MPKTGGSRRLRRTIAIDPNRVEAVMLLGRVFLESGKADSALVYIGRAVNLDSDDPVAHMRLGWTYRELNRPREARQAFRAAATRAPKLAEAHLNAGQSAYWLGDVDESVEAFQRAIALRPDYPVAHLSLGVAHVQLGQLAQAAASYELWSSSNRTTPEGICSSVTFWPDSGTMRGRQSIAKERAPLPRQRCCRSTKTPTEERVRGSNTGVRLHCCSWPCLVMRVGDPSATARLHQECAQLTVFIWFFMFCMSKNVDFTGSVSYFCASDVNTGQLVTSKWTVFFITSGRPPVVESLIS